MAKLTIEHVLETQSALESLVIFRVDGSCLTLYVLSTSPSENEWSGETGSVSEKSCYAAAHALHDWVRNPTFGTRVGRMPFRKDIPVDNYGIVYRDKQEGLITGEPCSEPSTVTLLVVSDSDAISLAERFTEVASYISGAR